MRKFALILMLWLSVQAQAKIHIGNLYNIYKDSVSIDTIYTIKRAKLQSHGLYIDLYKGSSIIHSFKCIGMNIGERSYIYDALDEKGNRYNIYQGLYDPKFIITKDNKNLLIFEYGQVD